MAKVIHRSFQNLNISSQGSKASHKMQTRSVRKKAKETILKSLALLHPFINQNSWKSRRKNPQRLGNQTNHPYSNNLCFSLKSLVTMTKKIPMLLWMSSCLIKSLSMKHLGLTLLEMNYKTRNALIVI